MIRSCSVLATFTLSFIFASCTTPVEPGDDSASIVVRLMGADSTIVSDSVVVSLSSLSSIDLSGEAAVKMEDLITSAFIPPYIDKNNVSWDKRELYGFRVIGADGFSPHQKSDQTTGRTADDLTWEQVRHGYVKKDSRNVAFDASITLPGMYKIKEMAAIELYRKIDLLIDTGTTASTVQVRLAEMPKTDFDGALSAKLADILAPVASPDSLKFYATALDNYAGMSPFSWAQMQTGYWISTTDRLGFEPDLGGQSKISYVKSIRVAW
ncbi:MAG: hypothetical protein JXA71_12935 [Chitinispirillaceae bacterium]|nr:hypothetical protein [Chitinispirillaceae bacterium]